MSSKGPSASGQADWSAQALTLALATCGALLFDQFGLPAPWLSGAMVAMALLVAAGGRPTLHDILRDAALIVSGIAMGTAVTPAMLRSLATYPLSILMLVVAILAITLTTQAYLVRFRRLDPLTALFSAVPGALSSVIALAADTRADMTRISVIQSFRLFVLVAVLPPIVASTGGAGARPIMPGLMTWPELGIVIVLALGLFWLMRRLKLPGPAIFAGTLVSAVLHSSETVTGDVPPSLAHAAFVLVGAFIGVRFAGITRQIVRDSFGDAIGAFVVGFSTAIVMAAIASWWLNRAFGEVLVAFAPGGLEAMIVLGAALGLDPLYIGLHHLVRFVGISLVMPVAMRLSQSLRD